MSEETRIVEEQVDQETTAEAAVSPSKTEAPSAEVAADEVAADVVHTGAADTEATSAEEAEVESPRAEESGAEESGTDETGAEESEFTIDGSDQGGEDGKQVVYLSVGQEVEGTVKRTTEFGAFVDIGAGRDGLIHISEVAVGRVNKVTDVVKDGQQVTAWIKKLDRNRNRISLTLIPPGTKTLKDLKEGEIVPGKVSKIMPYGAFVDIGVGTDALLHIREMSSGYVNKPEDVVKPGEEFEVRIISVDRRRRRIDLSLKGLRDEPEPEQPPAEVAATTEGEDTADPFAEVEVLSPMELAFKKAMEAEGVELDIKQAGKKGDRRGKRGKKRTRAIQEEIINRTLETMRD